MKSELEELGFQNISNTNFYFNDEGHMLYFDFDEKKVRFSVKFPTETLTFEFLKKLADVIERGEE